MLCVTLRIKVNPWIWTLKPCCREPSMTQIIRTVSGCKLLLSFWLNYASGKVWTCKSSWGQMFPALKWKRWYIFPLRCYVVNIFFFFYIYKTIMFYFFTYLCQRKPPVFMEVMKPACNHDNMRSIMLSLPPNYLCSFVKRLNKSQASPYHQASWHRKRAPHSHYCQKFLQRAPRRRRTDISIRFHLTEIHY